MASGGGGGTPPRLGTPASNKALAEFQTFTSKFGTPSAAWERRPLSAASNPSATPGGGGGGGGGGGMVAAGPDVAMEPLPSHGDVHGPRRTPTPALAPPTTQRVSNSTSTIYARNLVSNLDSDEVLSAIASVLHTLLSQQGANAAALSGGVAPPIDVNFSCFDERSYVPSEARKKLRWAWPSTNTMGIGAYYGASHSRRPTPPPPGFGVPTSRSPPPLPNTDDAHEGVPPKEEMFKFLCRASRRASFSPENTVIALIILNRVLSCTPRLVVHAYNWRLLYLSALLVAQKLYDDVSLDNASFPIVWRAAVGAEASGLPPDSLDVRAFNDMEAKMLELVRFNVFIPRSLYASFCFELRTIFEAENPTLAFPVTPLSPDDAARLESRTLALPQTLAASVKPRTSKSHMETTEGASEGVKRGVGPRAVLS